MKVYSRFMESLRSSRFTVSGEIDPPKDANPAEVVEQVEALREHVVAANVTDNPIGDVIMCTLATCVIMQQHGLEPIYQATCRDRNRIALQSDVIGAAALGIRNVLALTGDHPRMGKSRDAKPVFDLDSVLLTRTLSTLRSGRNLSGEELARAPEFHIGVGLSPGVEPIEAEIIKLEKKIEAGAEFVQTQCIYDEKVMERLREETSHLDVPILPGIAPLRSLGMAKFMLANVPGISIPDEVMRRLESTRDLKETAIDIAAELVSAAKDYGFPGVHIMPVGMHMHVGEIIERSGVR